MITINNCHDPNSNSTLTNLAYCILGLPEQVRLGLQCQTPLWPYPLPLIPYLLSLTLCVYPLFLVLLGHIASLLTVSHAYLLTGLLTVCLLSCYLTLLVCFLIIYLFAYLSTALLDFLFSWFFACFLVFMISCLFCFHIFLLSCFLAYLLAYLLPLFLLT